MSLAINVQKNGDSARLLKLIKDVDGGVPKALYRTIDATQKKAKVEGSKKIRSQLDLKKAYVDARLFTGKPTYSNLSARLYASKRGILMTRFKYRLAKSGGVDVKIKPKSAWKNIPKAFILPRLKNSGVAGIAVRQNGKLKMRYAPSPSQVLNTFLPELRVEMGEFANERLKKEVETIIRRGR